MKLLPVLLATAIAVTVCACQPPEPSSALTATQQEAQNKAKGVGSLLQKHSLERAQSAHDAEK